MSSFIRQLKPRAKPGQDLRSIGNLNWFYDANDAARFYANGDTVSNLFDLSGNGFHMSASTGPTLVTNADTNGNACLRFNGTSHFLSMADNDNLDAVMSLPAYSYFFVGKSTADTGGNQVIWAKYGNTTTAAGLALENYRNAANDLRFMTYATNATATNTFAQYGTTNTYNSLYIGISIYGPSSIAEYYNGGAETMNVLANLGNGQFNGNSSKAYIGALSTDLDTTRALFFSGDIYMIGCYKGQISTLQKNSIMQYLSDRFKISASF